MKQTLKIIAASALVTGVLWRAVPALAEEAPRNVAVVQTADLDLSSKAGARILDRRLVIAAREVCGTASDADLVGKNRVAACREDVLSEARATGAKLAASFGKTDILLAAR